MVTGRRVKKTGKSRTTLTAAIFFSPLRKGKCSLLIQNCFRQAKEQMEKDFDNLIIGSRQGKVVNGSANLRIVLGKLVADLIEENRKALGQSAAESHLLMQAMPPCHCGTIAGRQARRV